MLGLLNSPDASENKNMMMSNTLMPEMSPHSLISRVISVFDMLNSFFKLLLFAGLYITGLLNNFLPLFAQYKMYKGQYFLFSFFVVT